MDRVELSQYAHQVLLAYFEELDRTGNSYAASFEDDWSAGARQTVEHGEFHEQDEWDEAFADFISVHQSKSI